MQIVGLIIYISRPIARYNNEKKKKIGVVIFKDQFEEVTTWKVVQLGLYYVTAWNSTPEQSSAATVTVITRRLEEAEFSLFCIVW